MPCAIAYARETQHDDFLLFSSRMRYEREDVKKSKKAIVSGSLIRSNFAIWFSWVCATDSKRSVLSFWSALANLVYTNVSDRKGFKYEPWHYSYKPLSKIYLRQYLQLNLEDIIKNESLIGQDHFSKSFIASYLNQNILDINPELL